MSTLFNVITLGVVVGFVFLLTLLNLGWGVLFLTVVALVNVFLEELFPVEVDIIVGLALLFGFFTKFALHRERWRRSVLDVPVLILILAGVVTLTAMAFRGSDYFGEMASQVLSLTMIMGMSLVVFQILKDARTTQRTLQVFTATVAGIALLGSLVLFLGIQAVQIGGVEFVLYRGWGGVGARLGGVYGQPCLWAAQHFCNASRSGPACKCGLRFDREEKNPEALLGRYWGDMCHCIIALPIPLRDPRSISGGAGDGFDPCKGCQICHTGPLCPCDCAHHLRDPGNDRHVKSCLRALKSGLPALSTRNGKTGAE